MVVLYCIQIIFLSYLFFKRSNLYGFGFTRGFAPETMSAASNPAVSDVPNHWPENPVDITSSGILSTERITVFASGTILIIPAHDYSASAFLSADHADSRFINASLINQWFTAGTLVQIRSKDAISVYLQRPANEKSVKNDSVYPQIILGCCKLG